MNLKRFFVIGLVLSFSLCLGVYGQDKAKNPKIKEVKKLKNSLKKYSRYQMYNRTVVFKPIEFDRCDVKYKYKLVESIGRGTSTSSSISASPLDSYERSKGTQRAKTETVSTDGKSVSVAGGDSRAVVVDLEEKENRRRASIISFNIGALDKDSIRTVKNNSITFIAVSMKSRNVNGESEEAKTKNILFPITKTKKFEQMKQLFVAAIDQCK